MYACIYICVCICMYIFTDFEYDLCDFTYWSAPIKVYLALEDWIFTFSSLKINPCRMLHTETIKLSTIFCLYTKMKKSVFLLIPIHARLRMYTASTFQAIRLLTGKRTTNRRSRAKRMAVFDEYTRYVGIIHHKVVKHLRTQTQHTTTHTHLRRIRVGKKTCRRT